MLLTGMGERDKKGDTNYLIVDKDTSTAEIENTFIRFTQSAEIGVILINQHVRGFYSRLLKTFARLSIIMTKSSPLFSRSPAKISNTTQRRTRSCKEQPNSFTEETQLS